MKNKFYSSLMLMTIITVLFPSVCFSELKTVQGEYCDVYMGDLKNKKELEVFRKTLRTKSIENGLDNHIHKTLKGRYTHTCISYITGNYLEKVVVVSHTEKGRKICDKVKITFDPEVMNKYLSQIECDLFLKSAMESVCTGWDYDIDDILTKKTEKINIGLIIEIKIPDFEVSKREQLENEQEKEFFTMTKRDKDKYKFIDRRHLKTILEEQKLSSSGITDSETVKLGKILNLDIIVLRLIYENSKVTKVLKVDTGEVLLFKTYETYKETKEEGWISHGEAEDGDFYYDNRSIMKVRPNIIRVWSKCIFSKAWIEKNKDFFQNLKKMIPQSDYNKLHHRTTLYEIDCLKNTYQNIQYVDYNDDDKSLFNFYDYLVDKEIRQIIPDTILDVLRRKVCE
ncbi:MAG TPA: hypothetical protein HA367_09965 [Candidatus Methanofastidiosum sp.]|nr:hypothetical protein [Methanofastidiosum sp.]